MVLNENQIIETMTKHAKDLEYMKKSIDEIKAHIEGSDERYRGMFASKRTEWAVWLIIGAILAEFASRVFEHITI